MKFRLYHLSLLNRASLSIIATGRVLDHQCAIEVIESKSVIPFINETCKAIGLSWNVDASASEQEFIHERMLGSHHSYHTDPHDLPDRCDGFIYIAALAIGILEWDASQLQAAIS